MVKRIYRLANIDAPEINYSHLKKGDAFASPFPLCLIYVKRTLNPKRARPAS